MGAAEVIAFEEVRARKQWDTLRHQLHERFDQWLDTLETQWHEPPSTLPEVTATVWALRQQLTGGITETIVKQAHEGERQRHAQCESLQSCKHGKSPLFATNAVRVRRRSPLRLRAGLLPTCCNVRTNAYRVQYAL